jgi:hypothetical protein
MALRRAITKVKQRWSVIGWVTKNLLSRTPPCFGKPVKPLVPAAFAVVSTHQPALGPRGELWPVISFFANRCFCYLGNKLYNRVNKLLNIYKLSKMECKNITTKWLLSLDYRDTEIILER